MEETASKPLAEVTLDISCACFFYNESRLVRTWPEPASHTVMVPALEAELEQLSLAFEVSDSTRAAPGAAAAAAGGSSPARLTTGRDSDDLFKGKPFLVEGLQAKLKPMVSSSAEARHQLPRHPCVAWVCCGLRNGACDARGHNLRSCSKALRKQRLLGSEHNVR